MLPIPFILPQWPVSFRLDLLLLFLPDAEFSDFEKATGQSGEKP
jgi:hypothetical protein